MSKPYQQRLIEQYGFLVPKTLVTMVPEEARRFYDDCKGRVIYKSISAERSIVKPLTPADFPRLEQIRTCPVQLQETIPVPIYEFTRGRPAVRDGSAVGRGGLPVCRTRRQATHDAGG